MSWLKLTVGGTFLIVGLAHLSMLLESCDDYGWDLDPGEWAAFGVVGLAGLFCAAGGLTLIATELLGMVP